MTRKPESINEGFVTFSITLENGSRSFNILLDDIDKYIVYYVKASFFGVMYIISPGQYSINDGVFRFIDDEIDYNTIIHVELLMRKITD